MSLTPKSCVAARALLGWSMRELADRADVSLGVIQRVEAGGKIRAGTAEKISTAFDREGVELIGDHERTGAAILNRRLSELPRP